MKFVSYENILQNTILVFIQTEQYGFLNEISPWDYSYS